MGINGKMMLTELVIMVLSGGFGVLNITAGVLTKNPNDKKQFETAGKVWMGLASLCVFGEVVGSIIWIWNR